MIRLLIVDDDPLMRSALIDWATHEIDAVITEARSGNEAIRLLTDGGDLDVIISDFCMEDGNGSDLLRFLSENHIESFSVLFTDMANPPLHSTNEWFLGVFDKMDFLSMFRKIHDAFYGACSQPSVRVSRG